MPRLPASYAIRFNTANFSDLLEGLLFETNGHVIVHDFFMNIIGELNETVNNLNSLRW